LHFGERGNAVRLETAKAIGKLQTETLVEFSRDFRIDLAALGRGLTGFVLVG
jgi:hypothetical protein